MTDVTIRYFRGNEACGLQPALKEFAVGGAHWPILRSWQRHEAPAC